MWIFQNPEIIFYHFFRIFNLDIFLCSNITEVYRKQVPCPLNSSHSFWPILLKLYRCFKDGLKICMWFLQNPETIFYYFLRGWSGGAKVLCILHHWGVQLILAYSWARPAILVVGKGRGGMFLFLLFLHFHSCSSFFPVPLFHLLYSLLSLFSLSLGDDTK